MTGWIVPLADVRLSEQEVRAVAAVYRSGWLSQGPRVAEFERAFASLVGTEHAIAVASGTAALELSCAMLDLQAGDEVVLPALTFAATAAAVVRAGATPVFADVCAVDRPWLSADAARAALGARTRAIVNVSYGGHPGQAHQLRELADAHGLTLIEDAAHAVGSRSDGRHAGAIGHLGTFSFFANKNLPLGEGGMLVTGDAGLAARATRLRSHGLTAGTWARHSGEAVDYDVLEAGFNHRLDEPRAALGTLLLGRLECDNACRAALADAYITALSEIPTVRPAIAPDPHVVNAWHIFPVLLDARVERTAFRRRLHALGVQTSVHYPPLHLTTAFSRYGGNALPITEAYARRTVTLPLFPHMAAAQQTHVLSAVQEVTRDLAP